MAVILVFKDVKICDEFFKKYKLDKEEIKKIDKDTVIVKRDISINKSDFKKYLWMVMDFDKLSESNKKYLMLKVKS